MFPMNSSTFAPVGALMLETYFAKDAAVSSAGSNGDANFSHYGEVVPGVDDVLGKMLEEPDLDRRMALAREAELRILHDMPAWNALSLSFVTARNPRVDLGFTMKASYANFSMRKAHIIG
jgi:peptide/nickel transport system substrate-binding protein